MRELPIPFKAPMVRAVQAGIKTQTRRLVKLRNGQYMPPSERADPNGWAQMLRLCPYGRPGDRLWVREAHSIGPGPNVTLFPGETAGTLGWPHVTYLADGAVERRDIRWQGVFGKARPAMFMHRWASRITLEVISVRVERLQAISHEDAKAEGAWGPDESIVGKVADYFGVDELAANPRLAFQMLWESINGAASWAGNPPVWVVEFKRLPA